MYKAIFIDIDGTLRDDNKKISKRTKEAIKNIVDLGILVVICSGRPYKTTIEISKEVSASNIIISSNGAFGYDYKIKKCFYKNKMQKQACIKLYNLAKKYDANFIMNTEIGRFKLKETDNKEDKILNEPIESFLEKIDVMQCLIQDKDFEKIKSLKKEIEQIEGIGIKNQSKALVDKNHKPKEVTYYDVADINTSKGNGVKMVCKSLNIDLKDTISIGDDYNDVSMFETTGFSIAMGNANEEVKKKAKYVTLTNNEEGVALALEKLLKNRGEEVL